MPPVRVYLDSSDYSVLSDPMRSTPEMEDLLTHLRQWSVAGKIQCLFSATHLSEMAPVDGAFPEAAERRATLLSDLCGRNALVSQDVLFADELRSAFGQPQGTFSPYSSCGDWFPGGSLDVFPIERMNVAGEIQSTIDRLPLNREGRRKAHRLTLRKGQPRTRTHDMLKQNARTGSLEEILSEYPMRPQDARTIGRYLVGDASVAQANEAFLNSLRDPRWMMQWFRKHHAQLTTFTEWVRGPAKTMTTSLQRMADHAALVRRVDKVLDRKTADELFSLNQWASWQDELLVSVSSRLAEAILGTATNPLTAIQIDHSCPGLSTGIRSLHSAWWTVTATRPRSPKLSDFPDALHAMYAPYVDVFRADSFMAPYIRRYAARFGTTVVPKLTELKSALLALV